MWLYYRHTMLWWNSLFVACVCFFQRNMLWWFCPIITCYNEQDLICICMFFIITYHDFTIITCYDEANSSFACECFSIITCYDDLIQHHMIWLTFYDETKSFFHTCVFSQHNMLWCFLPSQHVMMKLSQMYVFRQSMLWWLLSVITYYDKTISFSCMWMFCHHNMSWWSKLCFSHAYFLSS